MTLPEHVSAEAREHVERWCAEERAAGREVTDAAATFIAECSDGWSGVHYDPALYARLREVWLAGETPVSEPVERFLVARACSPSQVRRFRAHFRGRVDVEGAELEALLVELVAGDMSQAGDA